MRSICFALVHRYINYANIAWDSANKIYKDKYINVRINKYTQKLH